MANGEPNMGRDAERADVPAVDVDDLGHIDVPASKSVMEVRSRLNRLFLLAVMAASAVGCGGQKQEHAHAKDFAPALDTNENQCIERDPNISHYDCRFVVSYGKCIGIPKDPEAEKLRIFDDATLALGEKWSKRSLEEWKRDLDVCAKMPHAVELPDYSTDPSDKEASIISLPGGIDFPSGPICPEGKMIFWTSRRLQKAK